MQSEKVEKQQKYWAKQSKTGNIRILTFPFARTSKIFLGIVCDAFNQTVFLFVCRRILFEPDVKKPTD